MSSPMISPELAAFLESGLSIFVATRDRELRPDGALAWAAHVHAGGAGLTLYLHEQAAREMQRNLDQHPGIAINFDLPTSHRACQVKGTVVGARAAREDERPRVLAQVDAFAADLEEIGIPRAMGAGWQAWPCVAFEIEVSQLFEQTPGPGAGAPLA